MTVTALPSLEVYSDESGIHGSKWLVVAGFSGFTTDWRLFENDWRACLSQANVPCFHAAKFFAGAQVFSGWLPGTRLAFIDNIVEVLNRRTGLKLVAAAVDTEAFFARTEDEREYLTGGMWDVLKEKWTSRGAPTKPSYLPFSYVFDKCNRTATRVDWFHDRQSVYAKHALRLHSLAKTHRKPAAVRQAIGSLTFGSKRDLVPLQAADLAAYLTYYRVTDGAQARHTEIGRVMQAFERFGETILVYDKQGIDDHLRASLPEMIREGRKPSQLRVKRRNADGRTRQRNRQSAFI